jgi:hypothetical protein
VSLVARHLEENGVPTVIVGVARDIIEHCGVARLVFTDFPLGSPCGEPGDADMQRDIVGSALDLLESATGPRTTIQSPFVWRQGDSWKATIFTKEQPWKTDAENAEWHARKELHRKLRAQGKT